MEHFSTQNKNEYAENQKKYSQELLEVEKLADKLGSRIEEGIKETVAILRAMDFPTSSSCAGHKSDEEGYKIPYVRIYAPAPKGWIEDKQNKELRELWKQENEKQREKMEPLLNDFNAAKNISADAKLYTEDIGIFGGFTLKNMAATFISKEDAIEKITLYQEEMANFTKFLKTRFLVQ